MRKIYLLLIPIVLCAMCISCGDDQNNPDILPSGDVIIEFNAQNVIISNPFEKYGVKINNNGAHVEIKSTCTDEVTYILKGTTDDGSLKVYSNVRFELIMNGVAITNPNDPALNIQSGKRVKITLAEGTSSHLKGGERFISEGKGEDVKAAIFSEGQLIFDGTGSLTVSSRYRHAICSDDFIRIDGGHIIIDMSAVDGLHANQYIEVNDGTVEINSTSDGMDAEKGPVNLKGGLIKITTTGRKGHGIKSATETVVQTKGTIEIEVRGESSKGFNCAGDMQISEGDIHIETSGDAIYDVEESNISSAVGIKCDGNLTIDGGNIVIVSSGLGGKCINVEETLTFNDGEITAITTGDMFQHGNDNTEAKAIKSNTDIVINGGLIYAFSRTHRGIDPNGSLTIAGGTVMAVASSSTQRAFDYGTTFSITGGTLLGIGGRASTPTAALCTQYAVAYIGNIVQDDLLNITSPDEKNILTCRLPCTLTRASILFGSPDLEKEATYTISSGGSVSGGTMFNNLYFDAIYSDGTPVSKFTVSSILTTALPL